MGLTHPALIESDEEIAAATLPSDISFDVCTGCGLHVFTRRDSETDTPLRGIQTQRE
jgi:hypothetical protein